MQDWGEFKKKCVTCVSLQRQYGVEQECLYVGELVIFLVWLLPAMRVKVRVCNVL